MASEIQDDSERGHKPQWDSTGGCEQQVTHCRLYVTMAALLPSGSWGTS